MAIRLLLVAAMFSATTSCGGNYAPTDAEIAAYSESPPPLDEPVAYVVYTHCGVESARIGGRWWQAVEPMYGPKGPGSPPDGWGDPYQRGRLTLDSADSATFEAEGEQVEFTPADDDRPLRMCR